ncbi:XkdF-like putative serine protease domain-containing protein [Bacillus pumilus]|nr:XkdF-like putative serine protease domain-containing protein [Bacillus pumilus]
MLIASCNGGRVGADTPDAHQDFMTSQEIERAAHGFY